MDNTTTIGYKCEQIAKNYLESIGYLILEKNWRYSRAEIDLIAKHNDCLIFVEVKSRSSLIYGLPEETVNEKKQNLLFGAAQRYMEKVNHDWEIRFDIISIHLKEVTEYKNYDLKHIKDVFH